MRETTTTCAGTSYTPSVLGKVNWTVGGQVSTLAAEPLFTEGCWCWLATLDDCGYDESVASLKPCLLGTLPTSTLRSTTSGERDGADRREKDFGGSFKEGWKKRVGSGWVFVPQFKRNRLDCVCLFFILFLLLRFKTHTSHAVLYSSN